MTPRPVCILLFLLCFHAPTYAQRALTWQPDTTLRIGGAVPFGHVIVEDVRDDKSNIGWLKTGALNRYADLVMADSVSVSLAAYTKHLLRGADTVPGELLVVLRDFRIEDRKGGEEIGTVRLHADLFWSATKEGSVFHLRSLDTLYETKRLDVTKVVQKRASQAVLDMMAIARHAVASPATTLYSRADALTREDAAKAAWPLYSDTAPPRGIYYSLDDLLHLRTSDTTFIDLKVSSSDGPPRWYFYRTNRRGKKGESIRPKDCFAIYDGKQWHISQNTRFGLLSGKAAISTPHYSSTEWLTTRRPGALLWM